MQPTLDYVGRTCRTADFFVFLDVFTLAVKPTLDAGELTAEERPLTDLGEEAWSLIALGRLATMVAPS
jgi:hypothetical protein